MADGPTERPSPAVAVRRRAWFTAAWLVGVLAVGAHDAGAQTTRQDQVFVARRGAVTPHAGIVTRNDVDRVSIDQGGGRTRDFTGADVVRVVLGRVPASYFEGETLLSRGEALDAARSFALAAADSNASEIARASAAVKQAEALYRAGARDATHFAAAADAAGRFVEAHPKNRDVVAARLLQARALRAAGRAAEAVERFAALHGEMQGTTAPAGYDVVILLRAGVEGAHAALEAGDMQRARATFSAVEGQISGVLAQSAAGEARARDLAALQAAAQLGEGHLLLAEKRGQQALTFFRQNASAAGENTELRDRALLGVALSLAATNQHRQAQIEFARFAALTLDDAEGYARALIGAAETALELSDRDSREQARRWLTAVIEANRPSAYSRRAQELLRTL